MVHLTRAAGLMEWGREGHVKEILQNPGIHENCIMVKEKLFSEMILFSVLFCTVRAGSHKTDIFQAQLQRNLLKLPVKCQHLLLLFGSWLSLFTKCLYIHRGTQYVAFSNQLNHY